MKRHNRACQLTGAIAAAALLAPAALAQTQYAVTILAVPPPYLGGNVSAIQNGFAGGWAYTNCNNQPGCASQEVAMIWASPASSGLDLTGIAQLTPSANITGVQGSIAGWDTQSGTTHAAVLNPLSSGHIDLNGIFFGSKVLAACNGYQAGYAQTTPITSSGGGSQGVTWHAMTWTGDPNSWTDLHNSMDVSQVLGCDGNTQVGFAASRNNTQHAVLWTGTRTSEVDLHSGPYLSDQATAVSAGTQVGWGVFQGKDKQTSVHALLWHGAPNTLTDIHPPQYPNSQALAAGGGKQAGYAVIGDDPAAPGTYHGLLWFGSAASVIDMNQFLPAGYTDAQLDAIDPVTGIVAGAAKGPRGVFEPAIWIPR